MEYKTEKFVKSMKYRWKALRRQFGYCEELEEEFFEQCIFAAKNLQLYPHAINEQTIKTLIFNS